jgi:hypothetical protein
VACCEKPLFEVGVDGLNDDWGKFFEPWLVVIGGHYYQRWGPSNRGDGVSYISLFEQGLVLKKSSSSLCIEFCNAFGPLLHTK